MLILIGSHLNNVSKDCQVRQQNNYSNIWCDSIMTKITSVYTSKEEKIKHPIVTNVSYHYVDMVMVLIEV